jgi:hypothetical protein
MEANRFSRTNLQGSSVLKGASKSQGLIKCASTIALDRERR